MCFKAGCLTLVVTLTLMASSCTSPHTPSSIPMPGAAPDELDRLIRLSQSDERTQWWPAVRQLGQLASGDDALREEIWTRARVNTLGMKFVQVKPGVFTQGPDVHRVVSGAVAHPVQITQGYFLAVTEVTNAQFRELFTTHQPDSRWSPDPDSPAVNVSWEDAAQFCRFLSTVEDAAYRLPTEAEWEHACRAGADTRFCFGDDPAKLSLYGWYNCACGRASPVALLKPNNWGIYDMHGNALEWVSDWFSHTYYGRCAVEGLVKDPKGPSAGRTHVVRGGAWPVPNPLAVTSTARYPLPLLDRVPFSKVEVGFRQMLGFRVVRKLD